MKKLFTLLFAFQIIPALAQKEDHIWPSSHICGGSVSTQINFNNSPATIDIVDIDYCYTQQFASICDTDGGLLMYSNGLQINNKLGQVIENSDSLNAGAWADMAGAYGYPIPQGSFFIRKANSDAIVYLFHMLVDWVPGGAMMTRFYYTVIDIAANNGQGKVLEKNTALLNGDELLNFCQPTAVRHANGRDWWIIVPNHMGPMYYRFLLTPNGIDGPWIQEIGSKEATTNIFENGFGQRVFSRNGDKFIEYDYDNFTQVFDFDRCTGLLSNPRMIAHGIDPEINNGGAGAALSPSGRFLYLTRTDNGYTLFQYDLEAPDILASEVVVYHCPLVNQQVECGLGNMLLAPDGKVYIGGADSISYSIIHQPDSLGLSCGFELGGLTFPLANPSFYFPYWPNYRLGALEGSGCDTIASSALTPLRSAAKFHIYPNPSTGPSTMAYELSSGMEAELRIVDALGRLLKVHRGIFGKGSLPLEALPQGIYLACLMVNGEVIQVEKMMCE